MNQKWITCWSKAQRGMGLVSHLYQPHQEVRVQVPKTTSCTLRFAFYYDEQDVTIQNVRVLTDHKEYQGCFHQASSICVSPGNSVVLDEIVFVKPVNEIRVCYELSSQYPVMSGVQLASYDQLDAPHDIVYGLCGIDIYTDEIKGCVRVIGDSITEQGNWTTPLASWLTAQGYVLLNHGISGNRLMRSLEHVQIDPAHSYIFEGTTEEKSETLMGSHKGISLGKQCFGIAGMKRIETQVMKQDQGICIQLFALGTNDLYQPGTFCAELRELPALEAYMEAARQCMQILKAQGSPCIVLAIPPLLEADQMDAHKEALRCAINQAYSEENFCDDVVLFDSVLCGEMGGLKECYHNGDHLHPNSCGGKLMAERIQEVLQRWLG